MQLMNDRNNVGSTNGKQRGMTYVVGRNEIIAMSKPLVSHRLQQETTVVLPELAPVSKGTSDFSIY